MLFTLRSTVFVAVVVAALAAAYLGWVVIMGIPLQVAVQNGEVMVDTQQFGEYYTSLSRIRLEETLTGHVVWEAIATGHDGISPVWKFSLMPGLNMRPDDLEGFLNTIPKLDRPFEIVPGREYRIIVRGKTSLNRSSCTFTAPRPVVKLGATHNMRIKLPACGTLTPGKERRRSHAAAYPRR